MVIQPYPLTHIFTAAHGRAFGFYVEIRSGQGGEQLKLDSALALGSIGLKGDLDGILFLRLDVQGTAILIHAHGN